MNFTKRQGAAQRALREVWTDDQPAWKRLLALEAIRAQAETYCRLTTSEAEREKKAEGVPGGGRRDPALEQTDIEEFLRGEKHVRILLPERAD